MLTRRQFNSFAVGGIAAMAGESAFGQSPKNHLRVIAYNIYNCSGWPKDSPLAQKAVEAGQMPKRLAQELVLYKPDIINFSESPKEAVVQEIAQRLGMNYVDFPSGQNWPGALLSRFDIIRADNCPVVGGERPQDLFTRHWGMAEVRIADGKSVVVHSAHLHPSDSQIRKREIAQMVESMKPQLRENRSMLLMGDLNHTPQADEYSLWKRSGWIDTFARLGRGEGPTIKADEPTRRIDYVWAAGPIGKRVVESKPLFQGAFRTNPADPRSFALSDHLPQLAVFETQDNW